MLLSKNGMNLVDLHVYVDGSAALLTDRLYDFTYAEKTPDFPLPFTYPPFAALVFFPLHYLPFTVIAVLWLLAIVVALYVVVWVAFELILGKERMRDPRWRTAAVWWTAIGIWMEPVRTTIDYGQVNVFLVLGAMLAVRSSRWWLSGGLIGVIAGIKLTPAISGLYFVARRRWGTALWSAVVFGATVGVSFLINHKEAKRYFGTLLGDADRIGPVGSVWNQSLRGALSRLLGYDVQSGPWWMAGVVVVAVLAFFAWRALGPDDRLGTLIVVQLFGLMVSPISWSHHFVWLLPTVMWLVYGPLRQASGARILAGYWLVTTLIGVPWVLSFAQPSIWTISRPGVLSWLGAVDVLGVLVLYGWMIWSGRMVNRFAPQTDLSREPATRPAR
jgi:alpha-1,2-mannosyltransferase